MTVCASKRVKIVNMSDNDNDFRHNTFKAEIKGISSENEIRF